MSTYSMFSTSNTRSSSPTVDKKSRGSLFVIYASQFGEFRSAIDAARETFSRDKIWSDQCDYVIYRMEPLKKTVSIIADTIKRNGKKSPNYNHYPLLVSACYFNDQIDVLVDCIREYKGITAWKSAKRSKQKLIVDSLRVLETSLNDLMNELDTVKMNSRPI